METEPRVVTADVAKVLKRVIRPHDEDSGETVTVIAERAEISTRTVYRVLICDGPDTLSLSIADRLLVAAGGSLDECELVWDK